MRRSLLILLFIFSAVTTYCQSNVAKIRYEQAEEAYNNADYRTTLIKLEEVQKLLGSVNPRILYLKIMSENALVEKGNYSYGLLDSLRKDAQYYVKHYESNENLEDKFREILALSDALVKYPADKAAYDKLEADKLAAKNKKKAEAEAALQARKAAAAKTNRFIDSLAKVYKFKPGLTKEEFFQYNTEAASFLDTSGTRPYKKGINLNDYYRVGPYQLFKTNYNGIEKVDSFMVIIDQMKTKGKKEDLAKDWQKLQNDNVLPALAQYVYPNQLTIPESEIVPIGLQVIFYFYNPNHNYNNDNFFLVLKFTAARMNKQTEK